MRDMDFITQVVIAIHGGAGSDITPENLSPQRKADYLQGLVTALRAGHARLQNGDSALDAIESAVRQMENDPVFNAGRGASLALNGNAELDASIMDGATRTAGAVTGVTRVKNPITLARSVMERSPYVMLTGPGADEFAIDQNLERVDNSYFLTPGRLAQLEQIRALGGGPINTATIPYHPSDHPTKDVEKHGTVGAVARDRSGSLAAATSTGGMAGKRYGRVGDSPIIGAGTFAENATCAVSTTGHGEFFIRWAVASDVAARMRYGAISLDRAASDIVLKDLQAVGAEGGLIALDSKGNAALPFNTPGMYRGVVTESGDIYIGIFDTMMNAKDL